MGIRDVELGPEDRELLLGVARTTWKYFEAFMGPDDHFLPADNFQEAPARIAHRTSPTNIGMGLLSTLAAHDLGLIQTGELIERIDATLTTMEGLERLEGHLFNWYDTVSLAPLPPRYVSTVDSGNLAGALIALSEGLRRLGREAAPARGGPSGPGGRLESLSRRAAAFADGMSFRFLYDPQRSLLAIGYRAADAEGPGPARSLPLRPPRLGGAPRELHRASRRATSRRSTGSTWAARSRACAGTRRSCRGARRSSST